MVVMRRTNYHHKPPIEIFITVEMVCLYLDDVAMSTIF
uniref:Uncharacterized protein n=1 Tax=Arundo donax TaxID=35708 RepID=A0A0A9CP42_ARUDO